MKKKILLITLADGRVIEKDLTLQKVAPLGAPANDESYASLCALMGVQGFIDAENTNAEQLTYIPPAQIKMIKVKFF